MTTDYGSELRFTCDADINRPMSSLEENGVGHRELVNILGLWLRCWSWDHRTARDAVASRNVFRMRALSRSAGLRLSSLTVPMRMRKHGYSKVLVLLAMANRRPQLIPFLP